MSSQAEFRLFWSDPVDVDVRQESGDPLGLRSWANRVAQQLVPGLRNGTDRVQGFGLICAALALADRAGFLDLGPDETFLRLERAWVLSQAAHRRSDEGVSPWPGNRQAQQFLNDKTADLGAPLLSRQLQMGTAILTFRLRAINVNTVKLGWDGGVFGLLKGLWPAGVVGPFDVPFGHLALDDSGCCASAPDRVEACDQAAQEGQPLSTTCVVVVRGEKRSGAPRTGG